MACIRRFFFGRKTNHSIDWSERAARERDFPTRDGEEDFVFILTDAMVKAETEASKDEMRKLWEDACRIQADLAVRRDALYSKLGRKSLKVKASEQADLMRQFHAME